MGWGMGAEPENRHSALTVLASLAVREHRAARPSLRPEDGPEPGDDCSRLHSVPPSCLVRRKATDCHFPRNVNHRVTEQLAGGGVE
eukprot:14921383-Alexandrium_andersonii.AAC.1